MYTPSLLKCSPDKDIRNKLDKLVNQTFGDTAIDDEFLSAFIVESVNPIYKEKYNADIVWDEEDIKRQTQEYNSSINLAKTSSFGKQHLIDHAKNIILIFLESIFTKRNYLDELNKIQNNSKKNIKETLDTPQRNIGDDTPPRPELDSLYIQNAKIKIEQKKLQEDYGTLRSTLSDLQNAINKNLSYKGTYSLHYNYNNPQSYYDFPLVAEQTLDGKTITSDYRSKNKSLVDKINSLNQR